MTQPNIDGARKLAAGYLAWIKPRWETLAGGNTKLIYSVEVLREELRVKATAEGAKINNLGALALCRHAHTDPYAYRLLRELQGHGQNLTGSGATTILSAQIKPPKAQGNRERNGVRDLILSILWVELQQYGLPKENKVRVGNRQVTPSIGTVISEAMWNVLNIAIEPRAIMAAVMKRTENKL